MRQETCSGRQAHQASREVCATRPRQQQEVGPRRAAAPQPAVGSQSCAACRKACCALYPCAPAGHTRNCSRLQCALNAPHMAVPLQAPRRAVLSPHAMQRRRIGRGCSCSASLPRPPPAPSPSCTPIPCSLDAALAAAAAAMPAPPGTLPRSPGTPAGAGQAARSAPMRVFSSLQARAVLSRLSTHLLLCWRYRTAAASSCAVISWKQMQSNRATVSAELAALARWHSVCSRVGVRLCAWRCWEGRRRGRTEQGAGMAADRAGRQSCMANSKSRMHSGSACRADHLSKEQEAFPGDPAQPALICNSVRDRHASATSPPGRPQPPTHTHTSTRHSSVGAARLALPSKRRRAAGGHSRSSAAALPPLSL